MTDETNNEETEITNQFALTEQVEQTLITAWAFPETVQIVLGNSEVELTPAQAREFAYKLDAAATTAERIEWTEHDFDLKWKDEQ